MFCQGATGHTPSTAGNKRAWLWQMVLLLLVAEFPCGKRPALCAEAQPKVFPRTHSLRLLASPDSLTLQAALLRIEREFAGHPQAAETLLDVLNRSPNNQGNQSLALIGLLRLFPQEEVSQRLTARASGNEFGRRSASLLQVDVTNLKLNVTASP